MNSVISDKEFLRRMKSGKFEKITPMKSTAGITRETARQNVVKKEMKKKNISSISSEGKITKEKPVKKVKKTNNRLSKAVSRALNKPVTSRRVLRGSKRLVVKLDLSKPKPQNTLGSSSTFFKSPKEELEEEKKLFFRF